jgi:hypothetical protein
MRKKWQTFQYVFKNSLWNTDYYSQVVKAPLRFSLTYFFVLLYLIILIQTLLSTVSLAFLLPELPQFVEITKKRLETAYPKDLVITVKNGQISTNKKEPYFIDIPETAAIKKDHFIRFDSNARVEDFSQYKSLILVTRDTVVYPDTPIEGQEEQYTTAKIAPRVSESFTNADFIAIKNKVNYALDRLSIIAPILLVGMVLFLPILMSILQFSWNMLYLAILSLLVLLIAYLFKVNWNYKNSFQALLHGSTSAVILTTLLSLVGIYIPLMYTATLLLWIVIVLSRTQTKEVIK